MEIRKTNQITVQVNYADSNDFTEYKNVKSILPNMYGTGLVIITCRGAVINIPLFNVRWWKVVETEQTA